MAHGGLLVRVLAACVVLSACLSCIHYVLAPENEKSAELGAKITRRVMALDAGEELRRQALLGADLDLWNGILCRAGVPATDAGPTCRPGKDAGK